MSEEAQPKPVLGITVGELNGIGLEVIIKTFADPRILNYCTPIIYGNSSVINYHRKATDVKSFNLFAIQSPEQVHHKRVNIIQAWEDGIRINFGQPSAETGKAAFLSLQSAVNDALAGKLDGLVTAPIDKSNIQSEYFTFPGHTEYLTQAFGNTESLMFLCGEHFRTGLVTGHVPISRVAEGVTEDRILTKLHLMRQSLEKDFAVRAPRLAVLGLNPHAGEEGLLGSEEKDIIIPAVEKAKEQGLLAFGPYPADGFFGTHMYRNFDGVLAMYHDQGLAPFKMMNFESGVNFTAGLPIVRTSPDHGTGYAIAGKDKADERSFRAAVLMAADIVRNRQLHRELTENPLESQLVREKERG